MQPPKAILETVIYATDLDAAERFYRDVVGLEVVKTFKNQFVFLRCGEQMLLIFNPENLTRRTRWQSASPSWHHRSGACVFQG